jgi:hypothetical protein
MNTLNGKKFSYESFLYIYGKNKQLKKKFFQLWGNHLYVFKNKDDSYAKYYIDINNMSVEKIFVKEKDKIM